MRRDDMPIVRARAPSRVSNHFTMVANKEVNLK